MSKNKLSKKDNSWNKIFEYFHISEHDFYEEPFHLTAEQIKEACNSLPAKAIKEPRILCKQDTRESRPLIFQNNDLFILPKTNGEYYILKGDGYIDIPDITTPIKDYHKKLDFELKSSAVGDSEMQFLDFAYANSLIRTFMNDSTLVLTIRGRKFTPKFEFNVGDFHLEAESVQTEVDAGYEGKESIVLIEAKNNSAKNTIIRQLYYPYRQWKINTQKDVHTIFFEKRIINNEPIYYIWQYHFTDDNNYNSIELVKSDRFRIV